MDAVTVTAVGLVFPEPSRVNNAYEYRVSAERPGSVTEVAFRLPNVTAAPADGEAGAVPPCARRTKTSARSASDGFVHDNPILDGVRAPTVNPDTLPGGVVSAGGGAGVVGAGGAGV